MSVLRVWRRRAGIVAAAGVILLANLGFFLWYRSTARLRADGLERERAALAAGTAGRKRRPGG